MKHLIFKKLEDGTYGDKLGSYEGPKDDSSKNRSYLHAEPLASHFEMPEGADEDCCVLVWVEEVTAVEAVEGSPEMWTKEGEVTVFAQPMLEDGITPDDSWTHVPAVEPVAAVEGVPAHWEVQEDIALVTAKAQATVLANVHAALASAKAFGEQIMNDFTTENIMLGITADNMTGTVRKNMSEVIMALQTGSLYDAITEAKAITADKKDAKYITDARLLSFVNRIEEHLGVTLSSTL